MAKMTRCARCGGESPADGRFCIDCGAALAPAAIGETTRLPGVRCPSCGNSNPEHARFCVVCGRGLAEGATPRPVPQPQPSPRPTHWQQPPAGSPAPTHSPRQHTYPRVAQAPTPLPVAPRQQSWPRHRPGGLSGAGPLLFLVGVFVLLMTGNIWPGILWLVGISSFVGAAAAGRSDKALTSLIWWVGLALLFATGAFWPGILVLVLLCMMVNGHRHSSRWWW